MSTSSHRSEELALISFTMRWVEGVISHWSRVLRKLLPQQSLCSCRFGRRSFQYTPWSVCFLIFTLKKPCVFSWAKIRTDFPENFNFTFFITTLKKKKQNFESDLLNVFNPWTISDCEVWWFDIFDSCSLIQPIRLLTFVPSKKCFWLAYFSMLNESKEHADDTCTLKK